MAPNTFTACLFLLSTAMLSIGVTAQTGTTLLFLIIMRTRYICGGYMWILNTPIPRWGYEQEEANDLGISPVVTCDSEIIPLKLYTNPEYNCREVQEWMYILRAEYKFVRLSHLMHWRPRFNICGKKVVLKTSRKGSKVRPFLIDLIKIPRTYSTGTPFQFRFPLICLGESSHCLKFHVSTIATSFLPPLHY